MNVLHELDLSRVVALLSLCFVELDLLQHFDWLKETVVLSLNGFLSGFHLHLDANKKL